MVSAYRFRVSPRTGNIFSIARQVMGILQSGMMIVIWYYSTWKKAPLLFRKLTAPARKVIIPGHPAEDGLYSAAAGRTEHIRGCISVILTVPAYFPNRFYFPRKILHKT